MNRSLVLTFVLVTGCRREAADESSAAAVAGSPSELGGRAPSELGDRVAELGDGAPLVLVIRPDHWGQARPHLATLLTGHPDAKARAIGAAADPHALLSALFHATKSSPPEDDPYGAREEGLWNASHAVDSIALAGWDLGRPIVMALGEPPVDGPPGAALATYLGRTELEPQRHQVSIPATDDDALVGALAHVLDVLGEPAPALVEGLEGARAWRAGVDYVAVLPQETTVRLVVLAGAFGEPTPTRLAAWKARLQPTPVSLPDTPALALALAPEAVVAVLARPWRLRGWATWRGFYELAEAREVVSRDQIDRAQVVGGAIAMSADLVMSQREADVDDWAFALVGDDTSLRVRAAASLTASGRKGWDDAWADACGEAKADDAAALGSLPSFDVSRLLALGATQRPAAVVPAFAEIFQECGSACWMYLASIHPLGLLPPARCDLLEGRVEPSALPAAALGFPQVAEALRPLREIRWQTRRDGDALVNETVLAFGEAAPASTSASGGRWDSPLGADTLGTRDECMIELLAGLREGLQRLGRDEPAALAKGAARTLAQLAPALACASEDSEPAAVAKALRSAFVGLAARSIDGAYFGAAALELLEGSCREHEDTAACSRAEVLRARPLRVPLTLVEASDCDPDRYVAYGGLTITVAAKGTWLDDTPCGTDIAALERALVSARGDDSYLPSIVMFVEPSLTAAQVEPTLGVLSRLGVQQLGIVVAEPGAAPRSLPVTLSHRPRSPAAVEVEAPPTVEPGPPAKKGLYAMKGPMDAVPQLLDSGPTAVLHVGIDDVELRTPTGAPIPLRGATPAERRTALEGSEDGWGGISVELDEVTPWVRVRLALEMSCAVELRPAAP